ncbi:MAG TPA: hypothetical protein VI297_01590 [Gemmatimonadales bacterium]
MRIAPIVTAAAVLALGASPARGQNAKTIRPGMTEAEVRATWGAPVTSRTAGDYTYLFYENGCLRSCGTYDLVIFQGGQVVDAIVRGKDHHYDGVSSSPADRKPHFTAPSDSAPRTP